MSPFAFYLLAHATPVTWVFVAAFLAACVVIYVLLGINEEQQEDVAQRGEELLHAEAENAQLREDYESVLQDNLELGAEIQDLLDANGTHCGCKRLLDAVRQMPADERADIEQWDRELGS